MHNHAQKGLRRKKCDDHKDESNRSVKVSEGTWPYFKCFRRECTAAHPPRFPDALTGSLIGVRHCIFARMWDPSLDRVRSQVVTCTPPAKYTRSP